MAFSYNIDEVSQPKLPSVQHDIREAKKFLMKHSSESNDNLYDHLSELLGKILTERPENAIDIFEEYSQELKNKRLNITTGIRDVYIPPLQYEESQQLIKFFKAEKNLINQLNIDNDINDDSIKNYPNLMELNYYLEQIDMSLTRSEIILLQISICKLIKENLLINVRFWGKILGRPKNYYVIEAELGVEELTRRRELYLEADKQNNIGQAQVQNDDRVEMSAWRQEDNANVKANVIGGDGFVENVDEKKKELHLVFPPLPSSNWKSPPIIPSEQIGMGCNKMVYFVCNSPGLDEWIELASVTPQQIVAARQIVHCFTGCLNTPVNTFPKFPGNEGNYLRTQISRISASTHVSPIGFFIFGKEIDEMAEEYEEEEEEDIEDEEIDVKGEIIVNQHYNIVPIKDLVDPSMSNWCHHKEYILEQGRTTWWDVSKNNVKEDEFISESVQEEEEEEEEEEGEEEGEEEMLDETEDNGGNRNKKEIGPSLLTPLSEDILINKMLPAWTTRLSSEFHQKTAIAMIRSNIWPGAIAFAKDKIFGNIYMGWGHKFNSKHYCPSMVPLIKDQYKVGPEIMEIQDPSVEQEGGGYKTKHQSLTKFSESEEDQSEEGEEEEEEEEHDDNNDTDN